MSEIPLYKNITGHQNMSLAQIFGKGRDRLLTLSCFLGMIDSGLGEVPREQKMLKGHLPSVIYHQVY